MNYKKYQFFFLHFLGDEFAKHEDFRSMKISENQDAPLYTFSVIPLCIK